MSLPLSELLDASLTKAPGGLQSLKAGFSSEFLMIACKEMDDTYPPRL